MVGASGIMQETSIIAGTLCTLILAREVANLFRIFHNLLDACPMQANLSCDLTIAQALGAQRKDGGAELGFIGMAQAVDCREWFRNIECINMPSVGNYVPPKMKNFSPA